MATKHQKKFAPSGLGFHLNWMMPGQLGKRRLNLWGKLMADGYGFHPDYDISQIKASRPRGGVLVWISPEDPSIPFTAACRHEITGPRNMTVSIPAGFNYDGASVPRLLWWFIPRADARFFRAATLHDLLYASREGSRSVADAILRIVAQQDRMPWFKRWAAYLAVRIGGKSAWEGVD